MKVQRLVVGQMATNCYIVDGIIIDPGDDAEYISEHINGTPKMIVATHGHFDHIMAAFALQTMYKIPFYIHPDDIFLLARMKDSAEHFLGLTHIDPPPKPTPITNIKYIHVPGHTPGSICLPFDDILIVGDTVFADGNIGRTDFRYSDSKKFMKSLKTITSYPKNTRILPGHGEEFTL